MRTLGLIGGTSWHSTAEYYRSINQSVNDHFGNNTNPPLLLFNLNQALVHKYQLKGNWHKIADLIVDAGLRLQKAGAESVLFCANTPHKVFEQVEDKLNVPIIHIADATASAIKNQNIKKVGFLGTKFSMEENFITGRISKYDIDVLVPPESVVIEELHRIIREELTYGKLIHSSKVYVLNVIQSMIDCGAEGVILGCTEFPLLISKQDLPIPIFDTIEVHSKAATQYILNLNS